MSFMPREVLSINNQVVVRIELPEFAVDDVKVFIGEEIGDLIDVRFVFQQSQDLEEVATTKLTDGDTAVPVAINNIEYTTDHLRGEDNQQS